MEFSRQEYWWNGLPFPPPGDLPDSGIEPTSPALWADSLLPESAGKPRATTEFQRWGTRDLSFPTRYQILPPAVEVQSLNHWTTTEVPKIRCLNHQSSFSQSIVKVRTGLVSSDASLPCSRGPPCHSVVVSGDASLPRSRGPPCHSVVVSGDASLPRSRGPPCYSVAGGHRAHMLLCLFLEG